MSSIPSDRLSLGIDRNLVFDFGMHRGLDTGFYLKKGFRVVSLEANPGLVASCSAVFAEQISSRQLSIVSQALHKDEGKVVDFYVNDDKDDWSSLSKDWSQKGGHVARRIEVTTVTLESLFKEYGLPYYIKCDVEGADETFCEQLLEAPVKPEFVSVEAISVKLIDLLYASGYDSFQLVNQALNHFTVCPNPAREGQYADVKFNGIMSGLFGNELKSERWLGFDAAVDRLGKFKELKALQPDLAHGWLDIHGARDGRSSGSGRAERLPAS